jgi:hypothetical protein
MTLCHNFAKKAWELAGYAGKDISVVRCVGDWFVETPKSKREIHAHCKWCAVAEAVAKEVGG